MRTYRIRTTITYPIGTTYSFNRDVQAETEAAALAQLIKTLERGGSIPVWPRLGGGQ